MAMIGKEIKGWTTPTSSHLRVRSMAASGAAMRPIQALFSPNGSEDLRAAAAVRMELKSVAKGGGRVADEP